MFSSVCRVFSMAASSHEHLKHLNTSAIGVGVDIWLVDERGLARDGDVSGALGVQGVFSLVEGRNTPHTSTNGLPPVFADGDAA